MLTHLPMHCARNTVGDGGFRTRVAHYRMCAEHSGGEQCVRAGTEGAAVGACNRVHRNTPAAPHGA